MIRALQLYVRVFARETGFVARDRNILMIILAGALLYPLLYGTLYWHKRERNIPVIVVDHDRSEASRELIRRLDAHPMLQVREISGDIESVKTRLYRMQVLSIVTIPARYGADQKSAQPVTVTAHLDASRFLPANDMNVALTEVVSDVSTNRRAHFLQASGFSRAQALVTAEPVRDDIRALFNPVESYGNFLTPALFLLILTQMMLIGLAESMGKEREQDNLSSLTEATSGNAWAMVVGKSAFYVAVFLAQALFSFVIYFPLYRLNQAGSLPLLMTLTLLALSALGCWGVFVGSFFPKKITALQVMVLTSYPVFLLSGYSWPGTSMPGVLRAMATLLPGTPYLQAVSRVTQMGAGWLEVGPELLHLIALGVTGLIAAQWRLKFAVQTRM